jgi:hypothetical protein
MLNKVIIKTRFADGAETVQEVILDRSLDVAPPTTEEEVTP